MAKKVNLAGSDFFLPDTFTLADSVVQGIETSTSHPKTRMDSQGLFVTNDVGEIVSILRPDSGALDIRPSSLSVQPEERALRFVGQGGSGIYPDDPPAEGRPFAENPVIGSIRGINDDDSIPHRAVLVLSAGNQEAIPNNRNGRVQVQAVGAGGTKQVTVLDDQGSSDFTRLLGTANGYNGTLASANQVMSLTPGLSFIAKSVKTLIRAVFTGNAGGQATTASLVTGIASANTAVIPALPVGSLPAGFAQTFLINGAAINFSDRTVQNFGGDVVLTTVVGQPYVVFPFIQVFNQPVTTETRGSATMEAWAI